MSGRQGWLGKTWLRANLWGALVGALVLGSVGSAAWAQAPEEALGDAAEEQGPSAMELAVQAREKGVLHLSGLSAKLELETSRPGAETRKQTLTVAAKEIGERVHTLTRFVAPAGVAGVAMLSVEGGEGGPEEISLYLPKLKRVRKVARAQRGQSFMDTELSYADLGEPEATKKHERLADGTVAGRKTYVLQAEPGGESPYGKVVVHLDQETSAPLQVEYADKAGKPLKRYRTLKLQTVEGRLLPAEAVMENLQKGGRTTLKVLEVQRQTLGDDAFTERALERG